MQFTPQDERSPLENLEAFISFSKHQIKLWSSYDGFDWDENIWPTHHNRVTFRNLESRINGGKRDITSQPMMSSPFIEFAKSYLRYTQQFKQTKTLQITVCALALLEGAFIELEGNSDITKASARHFDKACEIGAQNYQAHTGIGAALQNIAVKLGEWRITLNGTKYWKHPFQGKKAHQPKDDIKSRKAKLPNDDALLALAEIFSNGYTSKQDDETIYITCQTCLLLSAPQRISESRWYRSDLIREEKDSEGADQAYMAYWVAKNKTYVRKEIPAVMVSHAKEAVKRLTTITEEGRTLALYLEKGPTKFYRHRDCPDVSDDHILTPHQVAQAIGLKSLKSVESFLHTATGTYQRNGWTLNSLWNEVIVPKNMSNNPNFPYQIDPLDSNSGKALKMSESLLCFREHQLSTFRKTSPILLTPLTTGFYRTRLTHDKYSSKSLNIFLKHNYPGLVLKSHQCRHFLNTAAQEAGIHIDQITSWSTRASQSQSRTYMHQDPKRQAIKIADETVKKEVTISDPITEAEYSLMDKGPIVTTRYGLCTHDYTLTPCEKHADCLSCSELLICKGHKRTTAAIQKEYDQLNENLFASQAKIEAGENVAGRWFDSHKRKHTMLTQLLEVLTDPAIEDGSPVSIAGDDFSHKRRVIGIKVQSALPLNREELEVTYSDDLLECLKMMLEQDDV